MNKIITTIVIVVLLCAVGYYGYTEREHFFSPVPSGPSSTFISYTDPAHGISFSYPDSYTITTTEMGNAERAHYTIVLIDKKDLPVPSNGEGPTAITIDIYQNNLDHRSLDKWVKNSNSSNFKLSSGTYTSTTVDGVSAVTYTWSGLYEAETTAFLHKDTIVALSVTYLSPSDHIRSDYRKLLESIQLSDESGRIPELM